MVKLRVIGKQKIGSYEFTGIEGGFGEDKKAMIVKDIAEIHKKEVKEINQAIKRNRDRFKDGIDIIDLKQVTQCDVFSDYGFTKAQWGNANNIYILSERGYAKLLKILEDDIAWDIYDELVDNYFSMRESIKLGTTESLKLKRLEIMEVNAKTRRADLLLKSAMETSSKSAKEQILSDVIYELTGERRIPVMMQKEYTATDIANDLGITSNMVGRICNKLGLKAEKPSQNKYGRWASGKSEYSSKEVPQWIYFEDGVQAIKREFKKTV